MAVRQALRFTKETAGAPGVLDASATEIAFLRMTTPVTDQPKPIAWVIRDAAGSGRRSQTGTAQYENTLRIQTPLFLSQAAVFLNAFMTPTGTGVGLKTYTIDSFVMLDGGTKAYLRRLGMTPQNLTITANNSGQGVLAMLDMTFVGRTFDRTITVTDFPDPASTDYPSDTPYYFETLAGGVTIATSRTNFKSWSLSVKNNLSLNYDENPNPSPIYLGNRDVDWSIDLRKKLASDRSDYDAMTAKTVSFVMTRAGTSLTFNLHTNNYFMGLDDELPFDGSYYHKITGANYFDSSASDDLTLTIDSTP